MKLVGFRFGKKPFFKIVKSLVTVVSNMILFIYVSFSFIHKYPIELSVLNIVTLKFTMYILTVSTY